MKEGKRPFHQKSYNEPVPFRTATHLICNFRNKMPLLHRTTPQNLARPLQVPEQHLPNATAPPFPCPSDPSPTSDHRPMPRRRSLGYELGYLVLEGKQVSVKACRQAGRRHGCNWGSISETEEGSWPHQKTTGKLIEPVYWQGQ